MYTIRRLKMMKHLIYCTLLYYFYKWVKYNEYKIKY